MSFEFNTKLLTFLAEAYQSYVYGSFLTNNGKEAREVGVEERTVSVWSDVMEQREIYMNVFYKSGGPTVVMPEVSGM